MLKKLIPVLVLFFFILSGCGNASNEESNVSGSNEEEGLKTLDVEFLTEPNSFEPGQEGTIQVKVLHGEENVEDADEVLFEIWEKGNKEDSIKIEGELNEDGIYNLTHTFEDEGLYEVTAHVTARASHMMPTKEFNVGSVNEEDYVDEEHDHESEENHEHDNESEEDHVHDHGGH
ncbi:FixH family protein [Oceanobacillus manasiensis]|uniref:FixH family protein n=1 Tax=Oceanobacillus manasiensis TaxID=586413 RepID=UPI0005AB7419|nr:FixH family protein [Oceanobacillus manasiensis]